MQFRNVRYDIHLSLVTVNNNKKYRNLFLIKFKEKEYKSAYFLFLRQCCMCRWRDTCWKAIILGPNFIWFFIIWDTLHKKRSSFYKGHQKSSQSDNILYRNKLNKNKIYSYWVCIETSIKIRVQLLLDIIRFRWDTKFGLDDNQTNNLIIHSYKRRLIIVTHLQIRGSKMTVIQ